MPGWVEDDARRDQAIEAKAEITWGNICAAVKDAVETFNRQYRQSKSDLKYKDGGNWVSLSIQLPARQVQPNRVATARISFDRDRHIIRATFTRSNAPDVNISFDAGGESDEDGYLEVFLRNGPDGPRIENEDAASRLMLQTFFKTIQNA